MIKEPLIKATYRIARVHDKRVSRIAKKKKMSKSAVIRESIDRKFYEVFPLKSLSTDKFDKYGGMA